MPSSFDLRIHIGIFHRYELHIDVLSCTKIKFLITILIYFIKEYTTYHDEWTQTVQQNPPSQEKNNFSKTLKFT